MSIIKGLHGFNFSVIFLILTYFVRQGLLQKYNTCQPLPRSKVIHRFSKGVGNLWITYVCLWITLGSTLARSLLVLTSVCAYVGPHRLAWVLLRELFITRAHATSTERHWRSIVCLCEYLRFTPQLIYGFIHTWRDGDQSHPK